MKGTLADGFPLVQRAAGKPVRPWGAGTADESLPRRPFRLTGRTSLDSLSRKRAAPGGMAVAEKLGRVVRNQWEDIWILLDRGQEEPHLELRLHNHGRTAEAGGVSGGEWIGLPVRLLPDLLQALTHAQDQLRAWGVLQDPRSAHGPRSPARRADARQFPRVVMDPAAECRVVDPEGPEVAQAVVGQIQDVSQGGAQAWFPQRFPQRKQVDVFMTIEGVSFRGRAEVVGPDQRGKTEAKGGLYRHNLRWVALHAQGIAALSRVAPSV